MSLYSRIIVVWITFLLIVTTILGLLRLAPGCTNNSHIFSCNCDTESPYVAFRWLSGGISNTYYTLGQLKRFIIGDDLDICADQRMGIWDSLFGRKPKERRGLILTTICDTHTLIVNLRSLAPNRKEMLQELYDVGFRKFLVQKIKSLVRSTKEALKAFVDVPDQLRTENQLSVSSIITRLRLPDGATAFIPGYHCTCVFLTGACFCMCGIGTIKWLPESYKRFCTTLAKKKRKRKNIKKLFGCKYVAMKVLKSGKNFHSFHMVSKQTGKSVLLKCNRPDAPSIHRRGQAKAYKAIHTLNHRNIIGFVDWISYGIYRGLVIELAPYGNLKDAYPAEPKDILILDKISIFKQTLSAVAFLHQAGAAHLNIRPGSLLVFDKWVRVKLSGFSHVTRMPKSGFCLQYDLHQLSKPAEVVAEEPYDGFKADIWALGSLLFYIMVGDFFQRETKSPMHRRILCALTGVDASKKKVVLSVLARLLSHLPCHRPTLGETQDCIDAIDFSRHDDNK